MYYRILMERVADLPEGFCCGRRFRSNEILHRTTDESEADIHTKLTAVRTCVSYRKSGYPCKIVPEVPPLERLAILECVG